MILENIDSFLKELGKGYTLSSLRKMRQFYLIYRKHSTLSSELTWGHYRYL